jgi:hypothetical protein
MASTNVAKPEIIEACLRAKPRRKLPHVAFAKNTPITPKPSDSPQRKVSSILVKEVSTGG